MLSSHRVASLAGRPVFGEAETLVFATGTSSGHASGAIAAPEATLDLPSSDTLDGPVYLSSCGCPSCIKADGGYTPKVVDGFINWTFDTGVKKPGVTGLIVVPDTLNNDAATAQTLTVGAPAVVSTINTIGDVDVFKVDLVAGQSYDIGLYAKVLGPNGVPLSDAYIELFDAAGNLVTTADGGGPNTPSGLDALLAFAPQVSGTYYIHAQGFDQDTTNNTVSGKGDAVGDYEVFVKATTGDPRAYRAFYDVDSPLHSLDWGSEFRRSSRNPDGDNGSRDNGVPNSGQHTIDYRTGIEGKNVITFYFAKQGDAFVSEDPTTPGVPADMVQARVITDYEKAAYRLAFEQYAEVADLIYVEVQNRNDADLKILTYNGTPGPGASLLGRASPPGEESEGQMEYNAGDERYNQAGLTQGGFFFTTILHETGHAHGLAHPHDNGGRSSVMRGAGGGTGGIGGDFGDFGLSQAVFTIMSYNDGWDLRPDGTGKPDDGADFGWVGALSPLDIAVIQDKYGVNEEYRRGDDTYILRDANATGTFYDSIWDAGGTDSIRYDGARNAVIDLRAATLKYEEGGGGRVSYVQGIHGGFTIANGALIENASGGSGNDIIIGNAAANTLSGGAGVDQLQGGAGNDLLDGGAGLDYALYEDATAGVTVDLRIAGAQNTGGAGTDTLTGIEALIGSAQGDVLSGTDDYNQLFGRAGDDRLFGFGSNDILIGQDGNDFIEGGLGNDYATGDAGNDILSGEAGNDRLDGGAGEDALYGGEGEDQLDGGLGNDQIQGGGGSDMARGGDGSDGISGGEGNDMLMGEAGNDVLVGGAGSDWLVGGLGADVLTGGRGEGDRFVFTGLNDSSFADAAGRDHITDFETGLDVIDLSGARTSANASFALSQGGGSTFLFADLNGDGQTDLWLVLDNALVTRADIVL